MSELSAKIRALRGEASQSEFATRAGVSLRTVNNLELGQAVRLDTVQQVAKALQLKEGERLALVIAWLRTEAGPDADRLWIESKNPSEIRELESDESTRADLLFRKLTASDREQILKTMQRREVLNCLPAINHVWEKTERTKIPNVPSETRIVWEEKFHTDVASSSPSSSKRERRPPGPATPSKTKYTG
jgi:transcriptional regulator with XRE-family HTH domain